MRSSVDLLTLSALRGHLVPIPESVRDTDFAERMLSAMYRLGGVRFTEDMPWEIVKNALQYCKTGSRITAVTVNTVGPDHDIQVTLVVSTLDYPVENEQAMLDPDGVLAYVYNVSKPDCSELGYVWFDYDPKYPKKNHIIHRIG